jgi:hypothetical protein
MLYLFKFIEARPEFYSSFFGSLAAIIFSGLIAIYFWQKSVKISKDTKAQIVQILLNEIELNLNNISTFISGFKYRTWFLPFKLSQSQKLIFWPKFLLEFPQPSFELTQCFNDVYSSIFLVEISSDQIFNIIPFELRTGLFSQPIPEELKERITEVFQSNLELLKFRIGMLLKNYDNLLNLIEKEFREYKFKKLPFFEENKTYEKLKSFYTEI